MNYKDIEYYLQTLNQHIKDERIQTLGLACNGWNLNENNNKKGINICKVYDIADKLGILDKISLIQSPMNVVENELITQKCDINENMKKYLDGYNNNQINVYML